MIIPYNVDVGMQRWPWANWLLIATNVVTFIILQTDPETNAAIFVLFRGDDFRPIQLIGSLFGHADILHLVGNMLFLFVFGNAINAKLGHVWFLLLYLGLGVADSLIWLAVSKEQAALGASGAIFGIVGVFLVFYPKNDVSIFYWFGWIAAGSTAVSSYWVILAYVGINVLSLAAGLDSGVSYIAHVVGAALGFGIAMTLTATGIIKSERGEATLIDLWRSGGSSKRAHKSEYRDGYKPPPRVRAAPEPPVQSVFNELPPDLPLPLVDEDEPPPPPKPRAVRPVGPAPARTPSSAPRVPRPPRPPSA